MNEEIISEYAIENSYLPAGKVLQAEISASMIDVGHNFGIHLPASFTDVGCQNTKKPKFIVHCAFSSHHEVLLHNVVIYPWNDMCSKNTNEKPTVSN